jgi:hypothetical protein
MDAVCNGFNMLDWLVKGVKGDLGIGALVVSLQFHGGKRPVLYTPTLEPEPWGMIAETAAATRGALRRTDFVLSD